MEYDSDFAMARVLQEDYLRIDSYSYFGLESNFRAADLRNNNTRSNLGDANHRSRLRSNGNRPRRSPYHNPYEMNFDLPVQNINRGQGPLDVTSFQSREINGNDYDLLLQLDDQTSRQVLTDIELSALPSEVFHSPRKRKTPEVICIDCSDNSNDIIYIDCESPPLRKTKVLSHSCLTSPVKNPSCSVCLEDISSGQLITRLPCLHIYHQDCILPWLRMHGTCPVDKYHVFNDSDGSR